MKVITLYIGLDVHKDSLTIAVAEPGPKGEIRLFGKISNDLGRLQKALLRISDAPAGAQLEVGHQRWLLAQCPVHYAWPPKVSKELARRQEGQPPQALEPAAEIVKLEGHASNHWWRRPASGNRFNFLWELKAFLFVSDGSGLTTLKFQNVTSP